MTDGGDPPARSAWGVGEALTAASLWGTSGIFSVHLFQAGVTPAAVALLRPVLALAMILLAVATVRPSLLRIDVRGAAFLVGVGGAAVGLFQIAYQLSIDSVGVPSTVAMVFLAPVLVVAASGPVLGEWPGRRRVILALTVAVGVWLSVAGAEDVHPTFGGGGVGWGLGAAVGYAAYTLVGRYAAPRWGVVATLVYSTGGACVGLLFLAPVLAGPVVPPGDVGGWALLTGYALATVAVAQVLFFDALHRLEASRVSIAAAAEPVVAAVLATVLLGQGLAPLGWLGITLVVAGVVGVARTGAPSRGASGPE